MLDPSRIAFRAIPHSLLFYFLATFTPVFAAGVTVQTSKGVVEGYAGALASRFVVPYATPPTGDLRFKDPVPAGDFDGVYDASGLPPPCAQNMNELQSYTEDCLFLTIYTPPTFTSSSKLPVFVW
ncbi:carboxylesterase, partial [Pseudohyphozyma bogoriensis]